MLAGFFPPPQSRIPTQTLGPSKNKNTQFILRGRGSTKYVYCVDKEENFRAVKLAVAQCHNEERWLQGS